MKALRPQTVQYPSCSSDPAARRWRPQVVAVNRGDIAATLEPLPASSAWARHISFQPSQMQLHPKDHRTLVLTLDAQILGQLDERFSVRVSGASRPLSLHLRSVTGREVHLRSVTGREVQRAGVGRQPTALAAPQVSYRTGGAPQVSYRTGGAPKVSYRTGGAPKVSYRTRGSACGCRAVAPPQVSYSRRRRPSRE